MAPPTKVSEEVTTPVIREQDSQQVETLAPDAEGNVRRSERAIKLTPKAQGNLEISIQGKEKKFSDSYAKWKVEAKATRTRLKTCMSKEDLENQAVHIDKFLMSVMTNYEELRKLQTPSPEVVRQVDSATAITRDIASLVTQLIGSDEFNPEVTLFNVRAVLSKKENPSVFGDSVTESRPPSHVSNFSRGSKPSRSSSKQDAEAELAARESQLQALKSIQAQRDRVAQTEILYQKRITEERDKLERMEVEKEVEIALARVKAYVSEEEQQDGLNEDLSHISAQQEHLPTSHNTFQSQSVPRQVVPESIVTCPGQISTLLQAFQESVYLGRLPVPEPSVFSGDPIQFPEWKNAFTALIERKNIGAADKLFYLRKYTAGSAAKVIQGAFLRSDEAAYQDAWRKLATRYGDPFVIQRAFREKIAQWPKVGEKDAKALRDFSDFLNSCFEAIPHVKGLSILNDCEENRKIVSKLPEWIARRWNRQVTNALKQQEYPSFQDFCKFLTEESEVANNPMTSTFVSKLQSREKREQNQPKARVLATQADSDSAPQVNSTRPQQQDSSLSPRINSVAPCVFCKGSHSVHKCSKFEGKSMQEKKQFVQDNKLCFACLRHGHISKNCKRRSTCAKCKRSHPTSLHYDKPIKENEPSQKRDEKPESAISAYCTTKGGKATSMILPVWVASASDPAREVLTYAMLDTQSDSSFILDTTANTLGITGQPVRLKLATMTANASLTDCCIVKDITVRGLRSDKQVTIPKLYTREFIPAERSLIPTSETAYNWSHLRSIATELPPLQDCEIGMLIGFNCPQALTPRETLTGQDHEPYAVRTDLGWSIVGGQSTDTAMCHRVMTRESPITSREVLLVLEKDFSENGQGKVSQEDIQFLQIQESSIKQLSDGHLQMPLPFRCRPNLPSNKTQAQLRLKHLKHKLIKDPKYYKDYVDFVEDIIQHGEAEEATFDVTQGEEWYLPHHGVYNPRKPNKIRVVFDCSSSYHGTSLNDHLLSGPDLTNTLVGVLCRFRSRPVAIACDIERMFHQFIVAPEDRNYLKFLWWKKGELTQDPIAYRMKVHLFGATSSPGCANYGLKYLAKNYEEKYPLAASFLRSNLYVDDGLASTETIEEAIQLVHEARQLCHEGGLHLHKFISNNRRVLDSIPVKERATEAREVNLNKDELPMTSTLGIRWNVEKDEFVFKVETKETALTRRGILSMVASIYDPLGFLAPFVLVGKTLLQSMCRNGIGWDDQLPPELAPRWEKWCADFPNVKLIRIPRCLKPSYFGNVKSMQLHHFSDASITGYGQCSYLRFQDENNHVHCSLLIGKARVGPGKITTIPRLELTAAVVSVKISMMLKDEFGLDGLQEFFWTDSQVVLGYINNEARRFHTFVANRVQIIREHSDPKSWFYVDTRSNPADYASRGLTATALGQSTWYTGPEFLHDPEFECSSTTVPDVSLVDPEVRSVVLSTSAKESKQDMLSRFKRFSNWSKLVRAIARLKRRARGIKSDKIASVEERQEAILFLAKLVQDQKLKEKELSKDMDPFSDNDGIVRIGGRLRHSSLSQGVKHPIVLPRDSYISRLIAIHYHQNTHHQGHGMTQNEIRANGFWIISCGKLVSEIIHTCIACRRNRRPAQEQKMADLPEDRVQPSPPFTYCGIDIFGPFATKQGRKEFKRYGLLFTCLCSRAVHIELVDDLSTDAFINGLRCFIALRGKVRQIRSDQGSNFIGAKNEFRDALKELDTERVASYLTQQDCDFIMNAPQSSHAGGVWERQIRTVRSVINGVVALCPGRLDDSSMRTLFYEVMSIVNSRPLSVTSINDPTSAEPLTPNHILTMKSSLPLPPPGKFVAQDMYLRKRWRRVQYLVEQFWSRWRKEYLQNLNLRQCWSKPKRNMKVGDVVLISEPDVTRNKWPMGIVVETIPSTDNFVRKVRVKVGTPKLNKQGKPEGPLGVLERPVQKSILLHENT